MKWYIFIAGIFGVFTVIGHFTVGSKQYLKPVLNAPIEQIPKKIMQCVFHYVSVFLILSSAALISVGLGIDLGEDSSLLIKFISLNYTFFAVWQISIALTSGIQNGIFKLFQWIIFFLIALFAWLGV